MSQAGSLFVRGLETGAGWAEDTLRRRLAQQELERRAEEDRQQQEQAYAEFEYKKQLLTDKQSEEQMQRDATQRMGEAAIKGTSFEGIGIDPYAQPGVLGNIVGGAVRERALGPAAMVKEQAQQARVARLSNQIPRLEEAVRKMKPTDPRYLGAVNQLHQLNAELMKLDAEYSPDYGEPMKQRPGNVLNLDTAGNRVLEARKDLISLGIDDADPLKRIDPAEAAQKNALRGIARQQLDNAMRQHVLGLTGSDPGSFYDANKVRNTIPPSMRKSFDEGDDAFKMEIFDSAAKMFYERIVGESTTPGGGGGAAGMPPPSPAASPATTPEPAGVSDDEESDLTPDEQAQISLIMAENGVSYEEAEAMVIQARGQTP